MAAIDEPIPGNGEAAAAKWLNEREAYDHLPQVAANGPTALFWYVAGLLDQYKEQS